MSRRTISIESQTSVVAPIITDSSLSMKLTTIEDVGNMVWTERSAPSNPPVGSRTLYADTGGSLSVRTNGGVSIPLELTSGVLLGIVAELYIQRESSDYSTNSYDNADWYNVGTAVSAGTWTQVGGLAGNRFTAGNTSGLNIDATAGTITVIIAGDYEVVTRISGDASNGSSNIIEIGHGINGPPATTSASQQISGVNTESTGITNQPYSVNGSAIRFLASGDVITMWMRCPATPATSDLTICSAILRVMGV